MMNVFRSSQGQLVLFLMQCVAFGDPDVVTSSPSFPSASFPSDIVLGVLSLPEDDDHISRIKIAIEALAVNMTLLGGARVHVVRRVTSPNIDSVSLSLQVCSFLAAGTSAIMTTTPCELTQQLHSFASHVGILTVDVLGRPCDYEADNNHDMRDDIPNIMSDGIFPTLAILMLREQWNDVVVFFDSDYEPSIQWLVDALSRRGIRTTLFNVTARNATLLHKYREIFIQLDHFVVLCSHEGARWNLDMARFGYLDILGPKYQWIMADSGRLEPDDLLDLLREGDNVALVAKRNHLKEEESTAVNGAVRGLLESIEDVMLLGEFDFPVPTCKDESRHPWPTGERLKDLYIHRQKPLFFDIYTLAPHMDTGLTFTQVGYWSANSSLTLTDYLFPELHHGFNNRTFIVTTLPYPPFIVRYDNGTYGGICFEILHELQRVLNFSYRVIEPEDRRWGGKSASGNFSGMIGIIHKKRADFGVGIFGVNSDRQEAVDFTTPFMVDPSIVLLRKPDLASSQLFICLGPFSTLVWFLIGLSVLFTGTILWLLVWYHPLHVRQWKGTRQQGIYNPKIAVWQTFGALMQQGMVYIPTSHSARIVIAAWWFYIIVMVGTYNGNLIAFLTAPKLTTPVNSLAELSTSGMKYGFLKDSMLHGVFSSASGLYERMWEVMKDHQDEYLVDDNLDGMARALRDQNYGFLLEKSFYDTLPNKNATFRNESCAFARAKESFLSTYYAFPFQKNSPYTRQFSLGILRLLEAGLIQRWQRKWYAVAHRCTGLERTTSQTNISLAEAQGAFYILAIGLIVASLALFTENVWRHSSGLKRRGAVKKRTGAESDEQPRGYHVGSFRPKSSMDEPMKGRELQESFVAPTFSPYATDFQPQKVRKSKSFPGILSACCIRKPKTDGGATQCGSSNLNGPHDMYRSKTSGVNLSIFSTSPAVAWYDTNGHTVDTRGGPGWNPLRRSHSHNGTVDSVYFKDAETGEFSSMSRRRK